MKRSFFNWRRMRFIEKPACKAGSGWFRLVLAGAGRGKALLGGRGLTTLTCVVTSGGYTHSYNYWIAEDGYSNILSICSPHFLIVLCAYISPSFFKRIFSQSNIPCVLRKVWHSPHHFIQALSEIRGSPLLVINHRI